MSRLVSTDTKIKQLEGLLDTKDLNSWETGFVRNLVERTGAGHHTGNLTDAQVERLEELWNKHFA